MAFSSPIRTVCAPPAKAVYAPDLLTSEEKSLPKWQRNRIYEQRLTTWSLSLGQKLLKQQEHRAAAAKRKAARLISDYRQRKPAPRPARPPDIYGRCVLWDQPSKPITRDMAIVREFIAADAFTNLKWDKRIFATINHDHDRVVARVSDGTLRLYADDTGVLVCMTPPDTEWGRWVAAQVARGELAHMSAARRDRKVDYKRPERWGEYYRAFVQETELVEIALCSKPAFPQTTAYITPTAPARKRA